MAIAMVVGVGVVFSAAELWRHQALYPELATAFADAGLRSPRQLGKRLRQLSKTVIGNGFPGVERVGADHAGALWVCSVVTTS